MRIGSLLEVMGYKRNPIIFSDKDVYINFDKFESEEVNTVLITGLSGSGKSTLAKRLSEDYNAYYVEIDIISFCIFRPERANWEYVKEHDKYLYKYFKEKDLDPEYFLRHGYDKFGYRKNQVINDYIKWLCFERDDLDYNKVIVEGGDVAIALIQMTDLLHDQPIIIKGTSITKSIFRRIIRSTKTDSSIIDKIKRIFIILPQYNKMIPEVNMARSRIMNQEYDENTRSQVNTST